jgi:hypothetical protein
MSLFLLFSVPLFCIFILFLAWGRDLVPRDYFLISTFFKGLLCFFPAYIILAIVKTVVGSAYTGFALYLTLLVRIHLTPIILAAGAFLLVQRKLVFPATSEGIFLTAFSFLSGFYTLFGIADVMALYGSQDFLSLFLTPLQRLAVLVLVSIIARRFYRWEGRDCASFLGACAAIAMLLALIDWVYSISLRGIAAVLTTGAFLGVAVLFVLEFPRALGVGLTHSPRR